MFLVVGVKVRRVMSACASKYMRIMIPKKRQSSGTPPFNRVKRISANAEGGRVLLVGLLVVPLAGLATGVAAGAEPTPRPSAASSWGISLGGNTLSVHAAQAPLRLVLGELARRGGLSSAPGRERGLGRRGPPGPNRTSGWAALFQGQTEVRSRRGQPAATSSVSCTRATADFRASTIQP
jgi:hypothetical protein